VPPFFLSCKASNGLAIHFETPSTGLCLEASRVAGAVPKELIYDGKDLIYDGKDLIYDGKDLIYDGKDLSPDFPATERSGGRQSRSYLNTKQRTKPFNGLEFKCEYCWDVGHNVGTINV